jgi:hypothetical protein
MPTGRHNAGTTVDGLQGEHNARNPSRVAHNGHTVCCVSIQIRFGSHAVEW